jgi:zinc protease
VTRWTDRDRRTVLPNGRTVLVQREDSAPAAAVVTHVKAGFFDEPDRWAGISHVLEHMFFKGTARRGPGDIARETKAAGGYLNAGTGYDHTSYFVVLPASSLEVAIDIQADALQHSVIDAGELARELQVIIQEARRKLDSASAVAHETLNAVMFDRHRIRRWRIGREEVLAGFTRDDVHGYYRSRYVPRRTVVSMVGAIDEDVALRLAEAAYGAWPDAPGAVDQSPEEPPHDGVRVRTLRGDVTHAQLALGWHGVPPLDPDAPALDLAAAILGMGRGAWLYRALRETGLATSASAHFYAPTELGLFGVSAETEPDKVNAVLAAAGGQVARLIESGPDPEDLGRARTLLLTRWARRLESMDGRATALAEAESLKHYSSLDEEYAALEAVTAAQVREVAERYLVPDRVAAVVYHPGKTGADLDADQVRAAFNTPANTIASSEPAIPAYPRRRSPSGRRVDQVLHVALAGADLLIRRKTGVPTVTLGVYALRDGIEDPGEAGIGALTVRSAVRGAGPYDSGQLAFAFERLGGALGVAASADWLGFSTSVLADRLEEAAALLATVRAEARLETGDVERERRLMTDEALQVADDMVRFPLQLAFGSAFGQRGYGLPVGGLPETLPNLTVDRARAFYRDSMKQRITVAAVGDLDLEAAADQLAGIFGDLPERRSSAGGTAQAWAMSSAGERALERDKAQTAVAMLFPGPSRRDPRRHAAEVWAAVAGGLGGRLFESLRSRRSLAYTVIANSWQRGGAGALLTYIATAPEREAEAREEMLKELARFTGEPVSSQELSQAVNYLAGQSEVARQSAGSVLGEMIEAWLVGTGLEETADPGRPYRQVTAEAVLEVAREFLVPEKRSEGVIRGSASPASRPAGGQ